MGHIKWNTEWMFGCRDYKEDDLTKEPEEWEPVDLPHDWLIYNTQDLYRDFQASSSQSLTVLPQCIA